MREVGRAVVALVASSLGLLVIAVFFEVALEMADTWWKVVIGYALATGIALLALAGIYAALSATAARTATGWIGMIAGRVPPGFGARDGNLAAGLAGLVVAAGALWPGVLLYRAGVRGGELNWAVEGLALCGGGLVFGLAAAIPRLYFSARGGREPVRKVERSSAAGEQTGAHRLSGSGADGVPLLLTAGLLGVALSVCTANTAVTMRARDGVATLAYGDWTGGCIDPDAVLAECAQSASLTLVPVVRGRLRVEVLGECDHQLTTASGEPVALADAAGSAVGQKPPESGERQRLVFDPEPDTEYRVSLAAAGDRTCTYQVRYLAERGAGGSR